MSTTDTPEFEAIEPDINRISVLIVDDDIWTTRALSYALVTEPGFHVLPPADSGEFAVSSYQQNRPDVVLMDINMPNGINGIDATRRIRMLDPTASVVILSTCAPGPGLARAIEAGAMATVHKTCPESTLRTVVRIAAGGDDPSMLKSLAGEIAIAGDPLPDTRLPSPKLTNRELDVLSLICSGRGYHEIASIHSVSVSTVKTQAKHLRTKLDAQNLAQLVVRALQYRFYSP
ncbi:response regulator transcription factor [Brevibacterium otitidis]|uniref:Response regulator transcription factor n=1 Tax=Brevibacterium otitidis TaxID=53364 RepID=A0ABV5X2R4_9MICO|nr:response regulator transcription factor [Brevibacterium otitidis]BFF08632.1 response regulator transcription factor [Brevibacterium otitidis]